MRIAIALLALACSAPVTAQLPAPPPVLAKHIKGDVLGTTDLSWLRGTLPDASTAQKAEWKTIDDWARTCSRSRTAQVRAELLAMGADAVALPTTSYGAQPCYTVDLFAWKAAKYPSWAKLNAAAEAARERMVLLSYGARLGFENSPFDPAWANEEARMLLRATVRDQVYRSAMSWRQPGNGPPMSEEIWLMLEAMLGTATAAEDHKNTVMLKAHVAKQGWPTIARVGGRASNAAWLLVQHADEDPVFQLRALRLMEPLVKTGGVGRNEYAYLYDRVMLKLAGKQRYATQMMCRAGKHVPQPLENEASVGGLRAEMGLNTLAEYSADMHRMLGNCASP